MPGFCMSGAATRIRARVRVRSPSQHYKKTAGFIKAQDKLDGINEFSYTSCLPESESGNRVMVVVDSSTEAKVALEWALSHTVQSHDTIILLHAAKQDGKTSGEIDQVAYDLLRSCKNMCQQKRPEVHVEMVVREGKDKGPIIVEEAKRLSISLLVLGQRKQSFLRRLQMIWASKRTRSRFVEYCIQNANCMTIAVRRKNRKYGGYLITTKRHKNFWLLA
ncbi:hypothetical protein C2S52_001537 [Perilla frutescens var. hirtella]|nr:hypothetical protein C2S51_006980 [Perilla frutescens var. frutescens]KAH6801073.1 hypothetical protein C2S52_001537 [Perilla frutescens var. hirtella]